MRFYSCPSRQQSIDLRSGRRETPGLGVRRAWLQRRRQNQPLYSRDFFLLPPDHSTSRPRTPSGAGGDGGDGAGAGGSGVDGAGGSGGGGGGDCGGGGGGKPERALLVREDALIC